MQPCYTHPSGLVVYALNQHGQDLSWKCIGVSKDNPIPVIVLGPSELALVKVNFFLQNKGLKVLKVYAVVMDRIGRLQFNVFNYDSGTSIPPLQRCVDEETDIITIKPRATFKLTGMCGGFEGSKCYAFCFIPDYDNNPWRTFIGPWESSLRFLYLRVYPGSNEPIRYPFDVVFGFGE